MRVHVPVEPIRCAVKEEFLYNQARGHGSFAKGMIFALSSYKGHALTVQVLFKNGGVFSYLPLHALVSPRRYSPEKVQLEARDLVYHDCHDEEVCIHDYRALHGPVQCYFRRPDLWLEGRYLLTLDWYRGNDLLHLIKLENGQFCALPSHKVLFGKKERSLPEFAKLKQIWTVEEDEPKPPKPSKK
jgi:hypothetical protein